MGSGEFKFTANGVKLILTVLLIIGVLIGAVKGYTILNETAKLNAERYVKLEPQVTKNDDNIVKCEKDIIKLAGKLESIDKTQERFCIRQEQMDVKIDKILEKVR